MTTWSLTSARWYYCPFSSASWSGGTHWQPVITSTWWTDAQIEINVSPRFDWQTVTSQSARANDAHHPFFRLSSLFDSSESFHFGELSLTEGSQVDRAWVREKCPKHVGTATLFTDLTSVGIALFLLNSRSLDFNVLSTPKDPLRIDKHRRKSIPRSERQKAIVNNKHVHQYPQLT